LNGRPNIGKQEKDSMKLPTGGQRKSGDRKNVGILKEGKGSK